MIHFFLNVVFFASVICCKHVLANSVEEKEGWVSEYDIASNWGQFFKINDILAKKISKYQEILIVGTDHFGKMLFLDGSLQLTAEDEYIYHEMIVHNPFFHHRNPKKVLIIGGGDGGSAREVLKHNAVQEVTMVEIDQEVVNLCQRYLPEVHQGSLSSSRMKLIFCDGVEYLDCEETLFDIIICDGTDPFGSGVGLYSDRFFRSCRDHLNPDGIFVIHIGIPFCAKNEKNELSKTKLVLKNLQNCFEHTKEYSVTVPSYQGGPLVFSMASKKEIRELNKDDFLLKENQMNGLNFYFNYSSYI